MTARQGQLALRSGATALIVIIIAVWGCGLGTVWQRGDADMRQRDALAHAVWYTHNERAGDVTCAWLETTVPIADDTDYILSGTISPTTTWLSNQVSDASVIVNMAPQGVDVAAGADMVFDAAQLKQGVSFAATYYVPPGVLEVVVRVRAAPPMPLAALTCTLVAVPGFWSVLAEWLRTEQATAITVAMVTSLALLMGALVLWCASKQPPGQRFRWPADQAPALDTQRADSRQWLWAGVALLMLIGSCILLYRYYNPRRIVVNSDDAWVVLQSAYYSIPRDGVMYWGSDRIGALHVVVAHAILETLGLGRIVQHCGYLQVQQILCMTLGMLLLCRHWRGVLITLPFIVLVVTSPLSMGWQHLSMWLCRVGNAYPAVMCAALGLLTALLWFARAERRWIGRLLLATLVFGAALIASPGNLVLGGVWCMLLCLRDLPRWRLRWLRWLTCAALFGAVHLLVVWVRTLCDTSVHRWRTETPMAFDWSMWSATMARFIQQVRNDTIGIQAIMASGLALACVSWIVALLRRCPPTARRLQRLPSLTYRSVLLLTTAGVVYLVLLAANTWVHLNPENRSYIVPVWYLFMGAWVCVLSAVICRLKPVLAVGGIALVALAATRQAVTRAPREESFYARRADEFLTCAHAAGGSMPLLGEFWNTCVQSFFDPHRLPSSTIADDWLSAVMLPHILSHPRVWINFQRVTAPGIHAGSEYLALCNKLLRRSAYVAPETPDGWQPYDVQNDAHVQIGSNLLATVTPIIRGTAQLTNAVFLMQAQGGTYAEVLWPLGRVPAGIYLFRMTARYRGEARPSDLLVLHIFDTVQYPSGALAVQSDEASTAAKCYTKLMVYPGSAAMATARLYCLADEPYEVSDIGIYPAVPVEP